MIGDVIWKYRQEKHLSQAAMARILEVSPSYISSLERGVRSVAGRPYVVSYPVLERISKVTGVPIADLEKEMKRQPDFLIDPLTDEETDLILTFRRTDGETKAMIRRLLQYVKTEQAESKEGKSDKRKKKARSK